MPLPIRNRLKACALAAGLVSCLACPLALAQGSGAPTAMARNEPPLTYYSTTNGHVDRTLIARSRRAGGPRLPHTPAQRRAGGIGGIAAEPGLVWKLGPQVDRPISSRDPLSAGTWSAGVASVAIAVEGVRLYGALPSERCALAGGVDRGSANAILIQPFLNYNLVDGWYLTSVPVINADWSAPPGQRWTVPVGGGIGRIARIRDMPLSFQAGYYYNVERPDGGPDWALSFQLRLLFPG
jgi:hypothetical protein